MNSSLQALVNIAPVIKETLGSSTVIGVIDTKNFVYFAPSDSLPLPIKVGDPAVIPQNEIYLRAIKGEKITKIDPPEVFGVPVITKVIPIRDFETNEIVGLFSFSKTLEHEAKIDSELAQLNQTISKYT